MSQFELKPLSVGETLDTAIRLYREHFATFATIAVMCQGVPAIMTTYVTFAGGMFQKPGVSLVAMLLSSLGGLLAAGAIVTVVSDAYLGEEPDLGDSMRYALRKAWALSIAWAAKYLIIGVGLMVLIFPAIIFAAAYSVVGQAVVLEDLGSATKALSRSWNLTRGYRGKAVRIGFLVFVLASLPSLIGGIISLMYPSMSTMTEVGAQLVSVLVYPIIPCAFTLYYYDLRVRKEGFDLELMSSRLDSVAEPAA